MGISLFARSSSVVPETSLPSVSHEELVIRVNVLGQELAKLARQNAVLAAELAVLRQSASTPSASTVGPIPELDDPKASGRGLMRRIAQEMGRNEDGIRKALVTGRPFASLREKAPDLTTNVPIMRWLASAPEGFTDSRFAIISREVATVEEIARWK